VWGEPFKILTRVVKSLTRIVKTLGVFGRAA